MIKLIWHNGKIPRNLEIKQVYGVPFSKDGRIMLMVKKIENRIVYSLAGGTPETFDVNIEATLKRELMEEINISIGKPVLIGTQEVDENDGSSSFAQVRMVAIIDKIELQKPDPATGEIYGRILTHPKKAIEKLGWGEIGKLLIEEAVRLAEINFGIQDLNDMDEDV